MQQYVRNGDALLFLQGSQPNLLDGIAAPQVAELRRIGWDYFGPVAQQLTAGATNWTVAPAPSPGWANVVYADLPSEQRLAALWSDVFESCRVGPALVAEPGLPTSGSPAMRAISAWQTHLLSLRDFRDDLNTRQLKFLRYQGEGTDLTLALPAGHLWCTAQLATPSGLSFVANLPTEEVFTLPHRDSATGPVRVSRPVVYGGVAIEGIELEFQQGRVTRATAKNHEALLHQLLATDEGAARLGEVAVVGLAPDTGPVPAWRSSGRLFHHPLLDENAANHIALGEAYDFCLGTAQSAARNCSLIHVDLPVDARVVYSLITAQP
jgi:aminopeptidase